ncbi:putative BOI-related E3 ubiquitin-protein ligase 3 [Camellia lanceoleosa]|uniref:BOI-related E3 ubiquitin-protein ligase 3 n=1 Tax=Camellia lanceoleosa TaxID=1840588 RepID=A0ACC0FYQ8_9ERIC|nr:putative BOI-related E3 ubiquitin-protein ligase 3 [Camellia lanceoleosa]
MAVQAQYPSNVLLLDRSVQKGKNQLGNDYSLQPQPGGGGGGFLDQSHMIFANGVGGTNPRKRGREITATTTSPFNPCFSIQSQSPQLIDLTQLHTHQIQSPNVVSTGLRLAFEDQQQQQLQPQQQQQRTFSTLSPQSSVLSSLLSEDFATQIRQQRDEIQQFLQAQGENLRRTLAEKRQTHYRALLGAAEESVARRLREKEAEVEKAARRNAELSARAAQLSAEAQAWQARARAQEATAAALQERLQQAIMSGGGGGEERGEEMGCSGGGEAEDAESAYIDPDRVVETSGPSCKVCRRRVASVVVLPCRHLCLCSECGALAQACPLCLSFRESTIEVFLS